MADLCQPPEIAGPGFINLRLKDDVARRASSRPPSADPRLGIAPAARPRTFVIDYLGPQRGQADARGPHPLDGDRRRPVPHAAVLGHQVISDNHIGDWGTQFGMILYGYKHFLRPGGLRPQPGRGAGPALSAGPRRMVTRRRPRSVGRRAEEAGGRWRNRPASARHPGINAAVLAETAKLHAGDAENRRLWQEFLPVCPTRSSAIYRRLGVTFDHTLGESFYQDLLARWSTNCSSRGIARTSDGARVRVPRRAESADDRAQAGRGVPLRHDRPGHDPLPHGDLAARRDPVRGRSSAGAALSSSFSPPPGCWATNDVELQHVSFGTVLGDDGRPFKTRSGDTVGLEGLLGRGGPPRGRRSWRPTTTPSPTARSFRPSERRRVAETVGIAALKYADLSQNRTSDYVFSYDKMLAMNGNTATYMQYAYARVRSIFAKGKVDVDALRASRRADRA